MKLNIAVLVVLSLLILSAVAVPAAASESGFSKFLSNLQSSITGRVVVSDAGGAPASYACTISCSDGSKSSSCYSSDMNGKYIADDEVSCSWSCTTCSYGCEGGSCASPSCTPSCSGKTCGESDGCGGKCPTTAVGKGCPYGGNCGGTDACGNYCGTLKVGTPGECGTSLPTPAPPPTTTTPPSTTPPATSLPTPAPPPTTTTPPSTTPPATSPPPATTPPSTPDAESKVPSSSFGSYVCTYSISCYDGSTASGKGCYSTGSRSFVDEECTLTYTCSSSPCQYGCGDGSCKPAPSVCGNGVVETGESCDNTITSGGCEPGYQKKCSSDCKSFSGCQLRPECDNDRDMKVSIACGGNDCNDADPLKYAGQGENCGKDVQCCTNYCNVLLGKCETKGTTQPPTCIPSCSWEQCGQSNGCGGTCPTTDKYTAGKCGNTQTPIPTPPTQSLPDLETTQLWSFIAAESGTKQGVSYSKGEVFVNYSIDNKGADLSKPFYTVVRLNKEILGHPKSVMRNQTVNSLTKGGLYNGYYIDAFKIENDQLKCGQNVLELSADDSTMISESNELNNKRIFNVYKAEGCSQAITDENMPISKGDSFILGGKYTLTYLGADRLGSADASARFKNAATGETIQVVTGSVGGSIKIGGGTYGFLSPVTDAVADYVIYVDLNGDGKFEGPFKLPGKPDPAVISLKIQQPSLYVYPAEWHVVSNSTEVTYKAHVTNLGTRDVTGYIMNFSCGNSPVTVKRFGPLAAGKSAFNEFSCRYPQVGRYVAAANVSSDELDVNLLNNQKTNITYSVNDTESYKVKKQDYFILGGKHLLQYLGASRITESNPTARFKDVASGQIIEVIAGSVGGSIKIGGGTYAFTSATDPKTADYAIFVDLNGDGKIGGIGTPESKPYITSESQTISKNDYFVVTTSGNSYTLRYISALRSTESAPSIELQDIATGKRIDLDYKAQPGEPGVGAADAVLRYAGGTFRIWNASLDTLSSFYLRIDLNGDGVLAGVAPQPLPEQEASLTTYPYPFMDNGKINTLIVVGDQADSYNVISATDIASSLRMTTADLMPSVKLASEVADSYAQNVITVGAPCSNAVTADILGNPADCTVGLKPGKAVIKLVKHSNGKHALIVMGYENMDVRRAAKVLADYKTWQQKGLKGMEVEVYGTSLTDITIGVSGAITCTETDQGLDFYKSGITTGVLDGLAGFSNDYCSEGGTDENGQPVNLIEFYCTDGLNYAPEQYNCPNGCKDGKCVPFFTAASKIYVGATITCFDGTSTGFSISDNSPCLSVNEVDKQAEELCSGKCRTEADVSPTCGAQSITYEQSSSCAETASQSNEPAQATGSENPPLPPGMTVAKPDLAISKLKAKIDKSGIVTASAGFDNVGNADSDEIKIILYINHVQKGSFIFADVPKGNGGRVLEGSNEVPCGDNTVGFEIIPGTHGDSNLENNKAEITATRVCNEEGGNIITNSLGALAKWLFG